MDENIKIGLHILIAILCAFVVFRIIVFVKIPKVQQFFYLVKNVITGF